VSLWAGLFLEKILPLTRNLQIGGQMKETLEYWGYPERDDLTPWLIKLIMLLFRECALFLSILHCLRRKDEVGRKMGSRPSPSTRAQ
jgi:hypothetical protein